jgi:hypothetical protein
MIVKHRDHEHIVLLGDDGTMDTLLVIDDHEVRHCEAERHSDGSVSARWIREATRQACDEGLIE